MPQVASSLGTTQPYIPLVNATQLGKAAGLHIHFATLTALNDAVTIERSNMGASSAIWPEGQPFSVATEPAGTKRSWIIGGSPAASHARTLHIRQGLTLVLAADTNTAHVVSGAPASGLGANGDVAIDYAGNAYYTKSSGSWSSANVIYTAASATLAPITLTSATLLTRADHANRKIVYDGPDADLTIQTDAAGGFVGDDSFEVDTADDSPGNPTLRAPGNKFIVGNPDRTIGASRKGVDQWTVGTTGATSETPIVTIQGDADVGSTLTCTLASGWVGTGYQWTRNGANIAGATASTYVTQPADVGSSITCVVSGLPYIAAGITVLSAVPTLTSASINGTAITLVFSSALTSADPTGTGGLTFDMSGGALTVSSVNVTSGSATVTAVSSRAVANGETGTVDYVGASSSAPFANAAGAAADFTDVAVTNNTPGAGGIAVADSISEAFNSVTTATTVETLEPAGSNLALLGMTGVHLGGGAVSGMNLGSSGGTAMVRGQPDAEHEFTQSRAAPFGLAGVAATPTALYAAWASEAGLALLTGVVFSGAHQTNPFTFLPAVLVQDGNPIASLPIQVTVADTIAGQWYALLVDWSSGSGGAQPAVEGAGSTMVVQAVGPGGNGGAFVLLKQATGNSLQFDATVSQTGTPNYITSQCFPVLVNPA